MNFNGNRFLRAIFAQIHSASRKSSLDLTSTSRRGSLDPLKSLRKSPMRKLF